MVGAVRAADIVVGVPGGYLLTACLATGHAAGAGALKWLTERRPASL